MAHLLRKPQQGAAAVIVALWMGVALSCLMVLDIGHLFWQKRELQKIADLSAVAGASDSLKANSCMYVSLASAKLNGLKENNDEYVFETGVWQPSINKDIKSFFVDKDFSDESNNSCRATITRTVPYFFLLPSIGEERKISAVATALQTSRDVIKLGVSSELASIDTATSLLLGPLVSGLLGGDITASLVSSGGLAGIKLNLLSFLDALAVKLDVNAGDYEKLLTTDVEVGDLLNVMLDVIKQDERTAKVGLEVFRDFIKTDLKVPKLKLKLADIFGLGTGLSDAALKTDLDLFKLVSASLQAANSRNAVSLPVNLNLIFAKISVGLTVIEPPKWVIGDSKSKNLVAQTSQVSLVADAVIKLILLPDIGLGVKINAVSGKAKLLSAICSSNEKSMTLLVEPSIVDLELKLGVGETKIIDLNLGLGELENPEVKVFNPPMLDKEPFIIKRSTDSLLSNLLDKVSDILNDNLGAIGKALGAVTFLLDALLDPVLKILDKVLFGLLKLLGVAIGNITAEAQMTCGYSAELVY